MPILIEEQFLYSFFFKIVLSNKTCIDLGLNYCPCCIFVGCYWEAGHSGPPLFPADHSAVWTSSLHHCLPPCLYPVAGSHLLLCCCESWLQYLSRECEFYFAPVNISFFQLFREQECYLSLQFFDLHVC